MDNTKTMKFTLFLLLALPGFASASENGSYTYQGMQVSQPNGRADIPMGRGPENISAGPGEINGVCETKTLGPIPCTVPCRNLQLILMRDNDREVARANLDPRGHFTFLNLRDGTYSLILRKKDFESRVEGLTPGHGYSISPEIPN